MKKILRYLLATISGFITLPVFGQQLVGTWRLTAADKILPNGKRTADYGASPHGIAIFTTDGHYTVEIFNNERKAFAAGDREKGTPEEYRDALLTMSCHFGTYKVDSANKNIIFHIDKGSFPNGDGKTRINSFTLSAKQLSWQLPPRPNGEIPISVFARVH